jgi:hypothetical protein
MLKQIETLWRAYPDWRLGQLLVNADYAMESNTFYVEDSQLEEELKEALVRFGC